MKNIIIGFICLSCLLGCIEPKKKRGIKPPPAAGLPVEADDTENKNEEPQVDDQPLTVTATNKDMAVIYFNGGPGGYRINSNGKGLKKIVENVFPRPFNISPNGNLIAFDKDLSEDHGFGMDELVIYNIRKKTFAKTEIKKKMITIFGWIDNETMFCTERNTDFIYNLRTKNIKKLRFSTYRFNVDYSNKKIIWCKNDNIKVTDFNLKPIKTFNLGYKLAVSRQTTLTLDNMKLGYNVQTKGQEYKFVIVNMDGSHHEGFNTFPEIENDFEEIALGPYGKWYYILDEKYFGDHNIYTIWRVNVKDSQNFEVVCSYHGKDKTLFQMFVAPIGK